MAFISDEDVSKVRDASDIVAVIGERVPLRQRGRDFWCCCPFHNEKTPSCKIDPSSQLWHCFGCGEGGDVFGFIMKSEDLSFPDAVRYLAERAHIDIVELGGKGVSSSKKARLKDICKASAEFFHTQLMRGKTPQAASARDYLAGRGFGGAVPKRWMLGFAPGSGSLVRHLRGLGYTNEELIEANVASVSSSTGRINDRFYNRVIFPIFDVQGDCIAFGGRVIGQGEPKYLNSSETPLFHKSKVLYGLNQAKAAMASTGIAIVCEGYTDVIAMHEGGVRNAVATLGTSLTAQHIRLLSKHASKRIVYLFDGDAAGQKAADRALEFIDAQMTPEAGRTRIELCAVTLPDNLDPAEFMAAKGADELRALIDDAKPLLLYGIERRLAAFDLSRAEGRSAALASALSVLAPIKDSIIAKDYAVQIAGRCRVREQDALDALSRLKAPTRRDDSQEQGRSQTSPNQVPDADQGAGQVRASSRKLSAPERNRIQFERSLLSVAAQQPAIALEYADALAQTKWMSSLYASISNCMLETLSAKPHSSAAELISACEQLCPGAAKVLTSGSVPSSVEAGAYARFLSEELAIGDMEDARADLRAQLDAAPDGEERDFLFGCYQAMQAELLAKKLAHKPLVQY